MSDGVFDLTKFPVHLGLGARVEQLDELDGTPDWYMRYGMAHTADIDGTATAVFITAGVGTEHRPR
jgi:hypothetical protein